MSAEVGAKSVKGERIKPIDCSERGDCCPCDAFLRCSTRPPYGQLVWSDKEKRELASGGIAYNSEKVVDNVEYYLKIFDKIKNSVTDKTKYKNDFYKNIGSRSKKVMTFPIMSQPEIMMHMTKLRGELFNAGDFTQFQKSMILRANLVQNGLKLCSDYYEDETGKEYKSKKLTPYYRESTGREWNIDHVQIRAKGGCNRFCNACLLSSADNKDKGDRGMGCPCVDVMEKSEAPKPEDKDIFAYSGRQTEKYLLYNCASFRLNKQKESEGKAEHIPAKPLGTMDHYKQLCGMDNPLEFVPNKSQLITRRVGMICKSGK